MGRYSSRSTCLCRSVIVLRDDQNGQTASVAPHPTLRSKSAKRERETRTVHRKPIEAPQSKTAGLRMCSIGVVRRLSCQKSVT